MIKNEKEEDGKKKRRSRRKLWLQTHRLRLECGPTMVPKRWHQFASSPDMGSGV